MGLNRVEDRRAGTVEASVTFPVPTGPAMPQRGVPSPEHALAVRVRPRRAQPWWLGAHGGAGESTLAALVGGSAAADHAWPVPPGTDAPHDVVLVARTSLTGLRAAQVAATQWAAGDVPGVQLLGLVLMADAPGRTPTPLRDFARLVAGGVPRTWSVPWVPSWRLTGEPTTAPAALDRLRRDLSSLLTGARPGKG
ncbi:DUF6668 family protein [Georgenia subflava]|uniref:Uncharacterized protein n=1 Tax=Georgenia subflava TaxID=1622177 RepID=A0A6N7EFD9_9MICO|nr:DUF6668 family protein [Georgenia subflava]MPV36101.1 hypothetical protein [Georgenia subflava]